MNSRFPSRKHTCPATNGAGIFIGECMMPMEVDLKCRRTANQIVEAITLDEVDNAFLVKAMMRLCEVAYTQGVIQTQADFKAVKITGEVKS